MCNDQLKHFADEIRYTTMLELHYTGFGHYGGSLSIVETLAVLYGKLAAIDPKNRTDKNRDYVILSKGHSGPSLYATLALKGFFPYEWIKTLNQDGTHLPSHPDRLLTPGIDMTTGSLGQGISVATGIAYGKKALDYAGNVFAIVGDGELNEGQCWEAIQFASAKKLDNFLLFVDWNKKQNDGWSEDVSVSGDFCEKIKAFDYDVQLVDGSNVDVILKATEQALSVQGKPSCIVLKTTKGQGISYLETLENNHHIRPDETIDRELAKARKSLEVLLAQYPGGEK